MGDKARERARSQTLKDFICHEINLTKIVFKVSQSHDSDSCFIGMLIVFIGVGTVSNLLVTL